MTLGDNFWQKLGVNGLMFRGVNNIGSNVPGQVGVYSLLSYVSDPIIGYGILSFETKGPGLNWPRLNFKPMHAWIVHGHGT